MKQRPSANGTRIGELQRAIDEWVSSRVCAHRDHRIGPEQLERLAPVIQEELRKLALLGARSPSAALGEIQVAIFGEHGCGRDERKLFLRIAAPLARRIAIEIAPVGERFEACDISVADLGAWLDTTDSMTAGIIDLYCFAGASVKETAAVVGLTAREVEAVLQSTLRTLGSQVRLLGRL